MVQGGEGGEEIKQNQEGGERTPFKSSKPREGVRLEDVEEEVAASNEAALGGVSPVIEVVGGEVVRNRGDSLVIGIFEVEGPELRGGANNQNRISSLALLGREEHDAVVETGRRGFGTDKVPMHLKKGRGGMVACGGPSGGRDSVRARGRANSRHSCDLLLVTTKRGRAQEREGTGELGEEASAANRGDWGVTKDGSPKVSSALRHEFRVGSNTGRGRRTRGEAGGLLQKEKTAKGEARVTREPELGPAGEKGEAVLIWLVTQRLRNLIQLG